jgi:hypothetical protein
VGLQVLLGPEDGCKKVQSAWGRFVFDAADTVLGAEFIGNAALFVIQRADGIYLERMELEANRAPTPAWASSSTWTGASS